MWINRIGSLCSSSSPQLSTPAPLTRPSIRPPAEQENRARSGSGKARSKRPHRAAARRRGRGPRAEEEAVERVVRDLPAAPAQRLAP